MRPREDGAALVHGWIWTFAYFLYLPYTITFVVYDLLAPVFPASRRTGARSS